MIADCRLLTAGCRPFIILIKSIHQNCSTTKQLKKLLILDEQVHQVKMQDHVFLPLCRAGNPVVLFTTAINGKYFILTQHTDEIFLKNADQKNKELKNPCPILPEQFPFRKG
jgi:hypothetical protein